MNKIIALIGEAGSGKDFIAKKLIEQDPVSFCPIISCTTRPKRSHETNGVDYFFLTNEEFQNKVIKGQMLEYTSFNNWFYGTAYDSLTKDKINVGVFNPAGIKYLSRYSDIDLVVFRLVTSKKTRLLRQLRREEDQMLMKQFDVMWQISQIFQIVIQILIILIRLNNRR